MHNAIRIFIFLLLLAFSKQVDAHNSFIKPLEDSISKKERRVFVKFFYSPQLTYRRDIGDKTRIKGFNSGSSWSTTSYESKEEIPKYGHEIGLAFEFSLGKRMNLNIGASYDTQGFQTDSNITTTTSGWGDFLGNFSYTSHDGSYNYSFYYVSIPFILNYSIKLNEKKHFYFGTGKELKYLFLCRMNDAVNHGDNTDLSNRVGVFYTMNIGMSLTLEKNRQLFFEPNFKIQRAIKEMPEYGIDYQLWSAGCRVGIKF